VADESANTDPELLAAISQLKRAVPPEDHWALDNRAQELINDPDADNDDVVEILRREFGSQT